MARSTNPNYDKNRILADKAGLELTEAVKTLNRGGASGLIDELKCVADYGDSTRYLRRDWGKYFNFEEA